MLLAFSEEIGGARCVEKIGKLWKGSAGANADEKVRSFRISRWAGQFSLCARRFCCSVERKGLNAVLKQDLHMWEELAQGRLEFPELEFVFVERIRTGFGSGLRVITL